MSKKTKKKHFRVRFFLLTIMLFTLCFGNTIVFSGLKFSSEPIQIILNEDESTFELYILMEHVDGTLNINGLESKGTFDTMGFGIEGISFSVDGDYIVLSGDASTLGIDSGVDHQMVFEANAISDNSVTITSPAAVNFVTPQLITDFTIDTTSAFDTTTTYANTPDLENTHYVILFDKTNFDNNYPTITDYLTIKPIDIKNGLLPIGSVTAPFEASTTTISDVSVMLQMNSAIPGVHYVALPFTKSAPGGLASNDSNDNGAYLYSGYTAYGKLPFPSIQLSDYIDGGYEPVGYDDHLAIQFDGNLPSMGEKSDYEVWLDNDHDEFPHEKIEEITDYSLATNGSDYLYLNLGPDNDTIFEDLYDSKIIFEVKSTNDSTIIDLVNRNAKIKTAAIQSDDGTMPIPNFDPDVFDYYNIPVLPSKYNVIANTGYISATYFDSVTNANPDNQVISPGVFKSTVYREDGYPGNIYNYSIISDPFLLADIKVGVNSIDDFDPNIYTYYLELAEGTSTLPSITHSLDSPIPSNANTRVTQSGDLNDRLTYTIETLDREDNDAVIHQYMIKVTVENSSTPPDEEDDKDSDENDNDPSSGSSKSDNKKSDESVTDEIATQSESLIENIARADSDTPLASVDGLGDLLEKIQTPSGARVVLEQMPNTLDELMEMRSTLDKLDDQLQLDESISSLISETERLIGLLNHSSQSNRLIIQLIEPVGSYYNAADPSSDNAKSMMNSTIDMSNAAIEDVGTVQLNWNTVEVSNGHVYLNPTANDILKAARKAKQLEDNLEELVGEHLGDGIDNAIVSTITIRTPQDLENAVQSGARIDQRTLEILKDNEIQQLNLDMGPIQFGLNDKFIDEHQDTDFEFNIKRNTPLNEEDKSALPKGTSTTNSPVFDLSAKQNDLPNDAFTHPFKMTIDLNFFDYTPNDIDNLVIGRYNEESMQWEPSGGVYDPSTNTITIYRMHLSKYTVLKSEKNYSNIEDSWAQNEIAELRGKGIIDGDDLFKSSDNVTREEFAGWISTAYGLNAEGLSDELSDLDPDSPYYDAIASAYDQGIISANADGNFDPKGDVSKEEMAVMLAAAIEKYEYPVDTDTFELAQYEEDLPTWAVNSVETVVENGIVDESFFGSADAVTKEEAAAILYQVYR